MRLAHLSDPHLRTGPLASETAAGLDQALRRVAALDPPPDAVVITGDLADHGRPDEYRALREIVDQFPLPLHLAIGNHDDRDAFLAEFTGSRFLSGGARSCYAIDGPDATLIVLDSKDDHVAAGTIDDDQLGWLDDRLARSVRPAVLCLHHPPVAVGIPVMDEIGLLDAAALYEVLARHEHVVLVLAGHAHRVITSRLASASVAVAASTWRQVQYQPRDDRRTGYVDEPATFLLHDVSQLATTTHVLPIAGTSAPFGEV